MHEEQRQRVQKLLNRKGIDQALFAGNCSVKWLTGFAPPVQTGSYPFAGGPALVWYTDNHFTLLVVDAHVPFIEELDNEPDCSVISYQGYSMDEPIAGMAHLLEVFRNMIRDSNVSSASIGLEEGATPVSVIRVLQGIFPLARFVPIDDWLEPLRMIKSREEIEKLRDSFDLTGIGHAAARRAVEIGKREIDVWNAAHTAMQEALGHRVPSGEDIVVGYRQNNISGWPLDHEIRPNDSVIVDLAPILRGYWGDSCGTYYPASPSAEQVAMHKTVLETLDFAAGLLRPGVVAKELDAKIRGFIADAGFPVFPHHSGHGIGVSVHEAPRLVPYNDERLAEGMIIMIEPGIYLPGKFSVRLEDAFLITSDGAECLTHHDKHLP